MLNVAIKSLFAHKLRLSLTALSIILGVSLVAGTYMFSDSINSTFTTLFDDVYSGVDVSVRPAEPEFGRGEPSFSEDVLPIIEAVEGVDQASPGIAGIAQIIDSEGNLVGGSGPPTLAFSWVDDANLNPLVINEGNGRPPLNAGEIVIDAATAENNDFTVGDTLTIQAQGPAEDFELVGIANFGDADGLAGATISAFELREAQRIFNLEGQFNLIDVSAIDSVSSDELKQRIDEVIPDTLESVTGETQIQEQQDDINSGLGFLTTALLAFAGVSIFTGSFIIQNTFRIIIAQRSKELALLRAVGATRFQILRMVLSEALLISLIASVVGIFVGVGISYGLRALLDAFQISLPDGPLTLLPRTIIVSILVGVVVTMLAALVPALKASRVSPIEALRDNESSAKNKSLTRRGIVSGLVIIIGAVLMSYGLFASVASPIYFVGLGVLLQFIGVSTFAPLLSRPLGALLGGIFAKTRGMPGKLAQENIKRSPRRTASTAAALMIGTSLVVFVSIFAASVNSTIEETITDSLPADLTLTVGQFGEGLVPVQFADDLETLPEIGTVSPTYYSEFDGVRLGDNNLLLVAIDPDTFSDVVLLDPSEGAYEALGSNEIVVRSSFLEEQGWTVGQELLLELSDTASLTVEIVGVYEKDYDSKFLIAIDAIQDLVNIDGYTVVFASYASGTNSGEGRVAVDTLAESYPTVRVQDSGELVKEAKDSINTILGLFWGLLGFSVIIAVLGITNTLALSINERTRELGLLRAVGMSKRQVRTMVRAESIIISLFGATLGILMGIFFGWAVLRALRSEGLTGFVIPWVQVVVYFALAAVAGVIASIWPARRASKVNVLEALDFE